MTRRLTAAERLAATEDDALLEATRDDAVVERFWSRVLRTDTCWIVAGVQGDTYGEFQHHGRRTLAHRFSWTLANQRTCPSNLVIRHRCDNPPCVRPDHLVVGSVAQNVRDAYERSRRKSGTWPTGTGRPNALLDDIVVAELRRAVRDGRSIRSLAKEIGVQYSAAYGAVRGITWTHVAEPPVPKKRTYPPHRANFVRNNPELVVRAQGLRDSGLSLRQIAEQLGISKSAAFRCCRTETQETRP